MNENDLSDEAFWECTDGMTRLQAWQECRRRAEAIRSKDVMELLVEMQALKTQIIQLQRDLIDYRDYQYKQKE
jgi:hypothetical protein